MNEFPKLIAQELPGLMRYATALSGNYNNAEDLMAQALEKALTQVDQWDPQKNLKHWLLAIINHTYNEPRNGFKTRPHNPTDREKALKTPTEFDHLLLQELQTALHKLPVEQKQVFLLVTVEEIDYKDVKNIMNLPLPKVMTLLHQSRKTLRQKMYTKQEKVGVAS